MAVPFETPVVRPEPASIVATVGSLLIHPPPIVASVSDEVNPEQITVVPLIVDSGLTVTTALTEHPVGKVYEIVVVPAVTPPTSPDVLPITTLRLLLLHEPPASGSLKLVVNPWHTFGVPVIAEG